MIKRSKQQIATSEGMKRYWKRRKEKQRKSACRNGRSGKVSAKIIKMLSRPDGVTREQVLRAIRWKSISMQQVTRKAGFKLRVNEFEKPYRYKVVGDRHERT